MLPDDYFAPDYFGALDIPGPDIDLPALGDFPYNGPFAALLDNSGAVTLAITLE